MHMQYLVNSQEMKQYDKNTIEYYKIPSAVLMERAALAVSDEIKKQFKDPSKTNTILSVCGCGNNGGDGLTVARLLYLAGYRVEVLLPMGTEKMTAETRAQYETIRQYQIPEITELPESTSYAVIIDALFGIGLSREIGGNLYKLVEKLNQIPAYRIAVDIASGISADTGAIQGIAFDADTTVTFGFAKYGQLFYPGAEYTGRLIVADIGIDTYSFLEQKPFGFYLKPEDIHAMLPERHAYSNKGSYGKVLIVAGSKDMAGAAYFSAKAAYYSGCGLVRILTAKENRQILLTKLPEAIITTYDADTDDMTECIAQLDDCMNWADSVLIGPGLGTSPNAKILVAKVLSYAGKKIVFDADALNILSKNLTMLKESKANKIITPHLGEMSRLTGRPVIQIQQTLSETAAAFAIEYQTICVLKDARTVICAPDKTIYLNTTGNHGMATGGSGDVLAGLTAGFFAKSENAMQTAVLSCYLHGAAGDAAAQQKGMYSMTASDILEMLPVVIQAADGGIVKDEKIQ